MSMLLTIKIRRPRSAPDTRVTEAAGGILGLDQVGSWIRGQHDVHHEGGRVDFSDCRQLKMAKTQSTVTRIGSPVSILLCRRNARGIPSRPACVADCSSWRNVLTAS